MAEQSKDLMRTIVAPALITELNNDILVTPSADENSLGRWLTSFKFPKSDSRVQSLINEAKENFKAGHGSTGYISLKISYKCTADFDPNSKVNGEQCSLKGFGVDLLDSSLRTNNQEGAYIGNIGNVRLAEPVEPSAAKKLWRAFAQATGEKLYSFNEWAYKQLDKFTPYFQ